MQQADMLGWLAAGLVFAAFYARQMAPLRGLAIASNLAFISYASLDHLWPIIVLHAAMLPLNLLRLRQALSLARHGEPRDGTASAVGTTVAPFCDTRPADAVRGQGSPSVHHGLTSSIAAK